MIVTFTRNRMRSILDALENGHCITNPQEGQRWEDGDLLALAGTCMAELMFRREAELGDATDEPLSCDVKRTFGRLTGRMTKALNYALAVASNLTNGCISGVNPADKTYRVEVYYDGPNYEYMRVGPSDLESDEAYKDKEPLQCEVPTNGDTVGQAAE